MRHQFFYFSFLWTILANSAIAQLATGHDKFFGCIIKNVTTEDADFKTYFNQVTPENAGKWGKVEAERDVMDWTLLDFAYNYAKENEFPFKQHTFIWDLQQPSWMTGLSSEEQRVEVEEWIAAFCARYPDVPMIEPVNEATRNPAPYREALGGTGTTGYDWVIWGFKKARQYAPSAKLILNDYDVLKSNTVRANVIQIANILKDSSLIDAIGCQGHFLEGLSAAQIQSALDELAATGLDIYITELDIHMADDQAQKNKYQEIFPIMWQHPAVKGVTLWGYKQGSMWRTDGYLLRNDGSERPALTWLKEYLPSTTPNPYVAIVSPDKSSFYKPGDSLILVAEAKDYDGTVERVDFYLDDDSLGSVYDSAYTFTVRDLDTGVYRFTAVAFDNDGYSFTSPLHIIRVVEANILFPIDDSFSRSDRADIAQGAIDLTELNLRWTAGGASRRHTFLKFQVPEIPSGKFLGQALITLFGYNYASSTPITLEIVLAGNGWDEHSLTWNNQPPFFDARGVVSLDYPLLNSTSGIVTADVTPLLYGLSDTTVTLAIRIKEYVGDGLIKFASKENNSGYQVPMVELVFLDNPVYQLTVLNGTGGGFFEEGQVIPVQADAAPAGYVFDQWEGDTGFVDEVSSASTIVTMPAADITIGANFKSLVTSAASCIQDEVSLFPNPVTSGFLSLRTRELVNAIEILSASGVTVRRETVGGTSATVDITMLPPGLYELRLIFVNRKTQMKRFVKY